MAEEEDPFQHSRMSLGEHLRELRTRLFRGAVAGVVAFCVAFYLYDPIFDIVARPMNDVLAEVDLEQRAKYEAILTEERLTAPDTPLECRPHGAER